MDPQVERPELRQFGFDPVAVALEHRQEYVADALPRPGDGMVRLVNHDEVVARRPVHAPRQGLHAGHLHPVRCLRVAGRDDAVGHSCLGQLRAGLAHQLAAVRHDQDAADRLRGCQRGEQNGFPATCGHHQQRVGASGWRGGLPEQHGSARQRAARRPGVAQGHPDGGKRGLLVGAERRHGGRIPRGVAARECIAVWMPCLSC